MAFNWNRARAFLVTAEKGSLSAAARELGLAQPTLGRQVAALEQELDIVLFERIGRRLVLTPEGLELMDHVRAMAEAANRVSLTAAGQSQSIEGSVCITASEVIAAFLLPPVIAKLRREVPGIEIEIIASNLPGDLLRREADIAIRNFRPVEPDLVSRKIGDIPGYLYATPDYLRRIGDPERPADLSRADFIDFDDTGRFPGFLNTQGLNLTGANFPVRCLNQLVQWELVKQGVGIGIMLEQVGDAEPVVVRALPALGPIAVPMWLVSHRGVKTSRRVRMVFDRLAGELAGSRSETS